MATVLEITDRLLTAGHITEAEALVLLKGRQKPAPQISKQAHQSLNDSLLELIKIDPADYLPARTSPITPYFPSPYGTGRLKGGCSACAASGICGCVRPSTVLISSSQAGLPQMRSESPAQLDTSWR
jgi:hypothetical protein